MSLVEITSSCCQPPATATAVCTPPEYSSIIASSVDRVFVALVYCTSLSGSELHVPVKESDF